MTLQWEDWAKKRFGCSAAEMSDLQWSEYYLARSAVEVEVGNMFWARRFAKHSRHHPSKWQEEQRATS